MFRLHPGQPTSTASHARISTDHPSSNHPSPPHPDRYPCHRPAPFFCRPHAYSRHQPTGHLPSHSQQHFPHRITQSHISHQQTTTRSMAIRQPHSHSHRHPAGTATHFPPPSAAHRATDAPRHLLAPLPPPAPGSRIHAPVPQPPNVQPQPPTDSQQLQSILFQSDPHHHFIKPNNLMLPLNPFSLCPRQPAGRASKADLIRLPHQRHRRQPLPHPPTRGQHITTFQHNNPPPSFHHKPVPQTWVHHPPWSCSTLPRQGWTRRGAPCHCLNRTMTPLRTRGKRTTSDQAAASEVPIMLYPWMLNTPTTPSHTLFVFFVFVCGFVTAICHTPTIIFGH